MFRSKPEKKLNLKLYDMDGCMLHVVARIPGYYQVKNMSKWLISSNNPFFLQEAKNIRLGKYYKTVVAYGTNRQCYLDDSYAATFNTSCIPALPIIQSYLTKLLESDSEVVLDSFWMADIYGKNIEAGESYKLAYMDQLKITHQTKHADWMFDESKVSLLYAHIHRVCVLNPDADAITVDFYDDNHPILDYIHTFFTKYPDLLPKNIKLKCHHYAGGEVKQYKNDIKGTDIIDTNYEWSVRFIASMSFSYKDSIDVIDQAEADRQIRTASELRRYHEDDHYHRPGYSRKINAALNFNYERFINMRDHFIPALAGKCSLSKTPNYTTAEAFHQEIASGLSSRTFSL